MNRELPASLGEDFVKYVPRTRYRSGQVTNSLSQQFSNLKTNLKKDWDVIKSAKLTPEAQARQDEAIRNPVKGALDTFMDLPKQTAQREEQAGQALHDVTGGRAPKWVGSLMLGMLDPLSPPGGKAPISAVKNTLRLNKVSGIAKRLFANSTKAVRDRIEADTPVANAYRALITKYDKIKEGLNPSDTLDKVVSKPEFEADVKKLIQLKAKNGGLDLPSKTSFSKELGNYSIDGKPQRWGSKGVLKPVDLNVKARLGKQAQIPTTVEFDPHRPEWGPFVNSNRQALTTKLGLKNPEKDHLVRLENQIAVLGNKLDSKGGFIERPTKFMNELAGELHRRGHSLGDQNLNFLQMSEQAHRTGKYSRHIVSQNLTDAELPHTYLEADEIFATLTDGTKKWLKVDVIDINKGTFKLKDGNKVIPNKLIKSKGNYKFAGKEFEKGQRQGLSLTTRKILARIDDPKELADAYEMFATDAGAHEIMSGIQTAASYIYDKPAELDALSKQMRRDNIPNMVKFLKYALKTPQYKNDPMYNKLLTRFTDKLKQNMLDYKEQLKLRGSW